VEQPFRSAVSKALFVNLCALVVGLFRLVHGLKTIHTVPLIVQSHDILHTAFSGHPLHSGPSGARAGV
jgi:hypothetical protein